MQSGRYQNANEVKREGLRLLEQRIAEDAAKIEAQRKMSSLGIMDLEHRRFTQLNEGELEHYLEGLSMEAALSARETLSILLYRIPTHMLFDGEHARRVVQLLADVFTDALKLAAASALSVVRLVMDDRALDLGCWRSSAWAGAG